jgi:hypothetical protein
MVQRDPGFDVDIDAVEPVRAAMSHVVPIVVEEHEPRLFRVPLSDRNQHFLFCGVVVRVDISERFIQPEFMQYVDRLAVEARYSQRVAL